MQVKQLRKEVAELLRQDKQGNARIRQVLCAACCAAAAGCRSAAAGCPLPIPSIHPPPAAPTAAPPTRTIPPTFTAAGLSL